MAANAGIKLYEVVNNVWKILAIEWMIAAQALESRRPVKSSPSIEAKYEGYRLYVSALTGDRVFSPDIDATENYLRKISF
jgi:histidine ammonia-lyase